VSVTLVIHHAIRMRHIVICGLSGSTAFFHIISWTARFSRKRGLLNIKCAFWFYLQLLSETILILRGIERYVITHVDWSPCKVALVIFLSNWPTARSAKHQNLLLLSHFQWNMNFLDGFSKKILKYYISWKSVQWEHSYMRKDVKTEGWTDRQGHMTKLTVAFRNFAKQP